MRRTIFGTWTREEEHSESEKALEYICKLKKELDGTDLIDSGIAINNKFICNMFLQLFEKYPPTFVDIADFMKKLKGESNEQKTKT